MSLTRPSLFLRLKVPNNTASWKEFAEIYSGVVDDYARVYGRCEHDRNDIVQNVWLVLCRVLPKFKYQPHRGGFRHLLRRIVKNTAIDWQRRQRTVRDANEAVFRVAAAPKEDVTLVEQRSVLQRSLELARRKSSVIAWNCFERHVIERRAAKEVGLELGLSVNAVYVNASRVLDRVRGLCIKPEEVTCHG